MDARPNPSPPSGRPEPNGLVVTSLAILVLMAVVVFGLGDRRRPRHTDFIAPPPPDPEPRAAGPGWGLRIGPGVDAKIVIKDGDHPADGTPDSPGQREGAKPDEGRKLTTKDTKRRIIKI